MNSDEIKELFEKVNPGHFERDYVKALDEGEVFEDLIMPLGSFELPQTAGLPGITYGSYTGKVTDLKEMIGRIDRGWIDIFNEESEVYCAFCEGHPVSICMIEDMGEHFIGGRKYRVGGPGCVGTLPEYRKRGIGAQMVLNVTKILRDRGFDLSYIYYTAVGGWYEKMGYKKAVRWDKHGIAEAAEI
ncbi:MAG: GNAT family N-acetyltransferase [Oscillospiraceae bacterium]|nr:GNAT family N-acetyltransferase [Oscillospiraceae bacterium]